GPRLSRAKPHWRPYLLLLRSAENAGALSSLGHHGEPGGNHPSNRRSLAAPAERLKLALRCARDQNPPFRRNLQPRDPALLPIHFPVHASARAFFDHLWREAA